MYWLLGRKSQLSTRNKLLIYKTIFTPIWTWNTTLGYGFHFQQRNPRMLPIESLAHDSGHTLVCAKYGYPKGSPIMHKLLADSSKPDRSNVKGQMVPHVPGGVHVKHKANNLAL
jgi:hypothetical protein